ncbi:MAG TPA: hypothetical protein VL025_02840 [Thermoanaerobaculia bacterium]|nr:hypothetical protein [Thermoanaerobaculia bacterium]
MRTSFVNGPWATTDDNQDTNNQGSGGTAKADTTREGKVKPPPPAPKK